MKLSKNMVKLISSITFQRKIFIFIKKSYPRDSTGTMELFKNFHVENENILQCFTNYMM